MRARQRPAQRLAPANREHLRPSADFGHSRLVSQGMRTVLDHVAPAAIEQQRTHLWIDDQVVRVLALTEYPRTVPPNWRSG